jgi:energy-converting hydrogenase A subunit M
MIDIEALSEQELEALHAKYEQLRAECIKHQLLPDLKSDQ